MLAQDFSSLTGDNRMKRLMSLSLAAALTVASFATIAAEEAAPPSPEQVANTAILTRQGNFKLIANQYGPVGGMMRNRVPFDAALVAKNSARIEVLAGMIPELHMNDTRKAGTAKTAALDGVWTGPADFKAKADDLQKAAAALTTAAKGGDKDATMKAAQAVGKACGSCHDSYRAK
jgi:cytochrome c556